MAKEAEKIAEEMLDGGEEPSIDPALLQSGDDIPSDEPEVKAEQAADPPGGKESENDPPGDGQQWADVEDEPEIEDVEAEFPSYLLEETGLTAEQAVEKFGSPEALEEAVALRDAYDLRAARQQPAQATAQPQPQGQPQPVPVQRQATVSDDKPAFPQFELAPPAEGEWADEVVELADQINGHYSGQIQELSMMLGQVLSSVHGQQQAVAAASEQQEVAEFEGAIEKLADSYGDIFGKGSASELNPNGNAFANRRRLWESSKAIQQIRESRGLKPIGVNDLVSRAVRSEFPDVHDSTVRKQVTQKVAKRQKQFVSRPRGKRQSAQTNSEAAVNRWATALQEAGQLPHQSLMGEIADGV